MLPKGGWRGRGEGAGIAVQLYRWELTQQGCTGWGDVVFPASGRALGCTLLQRCLPGVCVAVCPVLPLPQALRCP